jgi:predicted dithiol-disulfide oxidoreductase (DUF899 family)
MAIDPANDPPVASPEEWRAARIALLRAEKELSRQRDEVAAARRRLPMVEVTQPYVFRGAGGDASMLDLFESRHQLVVYHFMLDPEWDEGCPSCSFIVDNIGHLSHAHARDTTVVLVSRAPYEKLAAYSQRMGWNVPWYSSYGSSFNYDFHVTIDERVAPVEYNYRDQAQLERDDVAWRDWSGEQPGASAFLRHGDRVFHTYSVYSRGLDLLAGTYHWLDLTARGRQEDWEEPKGRSDCEAMGWLRRHDRYDEGQVPAAGGVSG